MCKPDIQEITKRRNDAHYPKIYVTYAKNYRVSTLTQMVATSDVANIHNNEWLADFKNILLLRHDCLQRTADMCQDWWQPSTRPQILSDVLCVPMSDAFVSCTIMTNIDTFI